MAKTYDEVKEVIATITNEVEDGANTGNRIGSAMNDIVDYAKEVTDIQSEETDKKVSELEASTEQKLKDLVVQETGDGENVVMSQKAVTEKIAEFNEWSDKGYSEVLVDADNRIIESRDADGNKTIYIDVEVKGKFINNDVPSKSDVYRQISEYNEAKDNVYSEVLIDKDNKMLESRDEDGTKNIYTDVNIKDSEVLQSVDENAVYLSVDVDVDGKIHHAIMRDGTHYFSRLSSPTIDNIDKDVNPYGKLPSYYTNEWLNNMINGVRESVKALNGVSFLFFTDLHLSHNAQNSKFLIKEILDKTNVPFAICGGDIIYSYGNEQDLDKSINDFNEYISVIGKDRLFCLRGNHDLGIIDNSVTPNVSYIKSMAEVNSLFSANNGWYASGSLAGHICCYLDNKEQRTRIILLNSEDKQDESYYWGSRHYISQAQIDWLLDDALNVDNYNFVILSHTPSDNTFSGYDKSQDVLQELLVAINNKQVFSISNQDVTASKDFSATTNKVICHISGHDHEDESNIDRNLLSMTTTCDYAETGRSGLAEQAFDIYTINYDERKIKTYRVGYGNNREWNINN